MRDCIVILVAVTWCLQYESCCGQSRPNIVLIVADDLGWDDVGFHGSEIKTPNLDKLAYDGIILNNYYVSPICTPTRGCLMTGRHPIHLGLQHEVIRAAAPWGLPLNHTTMAEHLKKLGYSTHAVGKWHLGFFRTEYLPTNRGFDSHFGYWGGKEDYYDHLDNDAVPGFLPVLTSVHCKRLTAFTHEIAVEGVDHQKYFFGHLWWHLGFFKEEYLPTNRGFDSHFGYWTGKEDYFDHVNKNVYWGLDFRRNMDVVNHTFYSTDQYTKEALTIIDNHDKSQPLFLYFAHQAVHAGNGNAPLQAPQEYVDRFPYILNSRRRTFAGMVAALDDSVGAVVRALNHHGMMDNTIIVFTTDNGGPANNYDGNAACNFPLRGIKNTLWEGGVHGVGFVHSNLLKKRHIKTDNMVHVSDWLPTLYSAAGGNITELGTIDGMDLWEMLQSDGPPQRNEILHNIDPKSKFAAIRVGDYKLIEGDISGGRNDGWYQCTPPLTNDTLIDYLDNIPYYKEEIDIRISINKRSTPNTPYLINCGNIPDNYKQNCFPHKAPCLFHILTDPCEYFNIADKYPAVVQNLQRRIKEYSQTAVEPVNKPVDKEANPALHDGVWVPWQGSDN